MESLARGRDARTYVTELRHVKIFADGADLEGMVAELCGATRSSRGFTTNPTLMRKRGRRPTTRRFARKVLELDHRPARSRSRSSPTSSPR